MSQRRETFYSKVNGTLEFGCGSPLQYLATLSISYSTQKHSLHVFNSPLLVILNQFLSLLYIRYLPHDSLCSLSSYDITVYLLYLFPFYDKMMYNSFSLLLLNPTNCSAACSSLPLPYFCLFNLLLNHLPCVCVRVCVSRSRSLSLKYLFPLPPPSPSLTHRHIPSPSCCLSDNILKYSACVRACMLPCVRARETHL